MEGKKGRENEEREEKDGRKRGSEMVRKKKEGE